MTIAQRSSSADDLCAPALCVALRLRNLDLVARAFSPSLALDERRITEVDLVLQRTPDAVGADAIAHKVPVGFLCLAFGLRERAVARTVAVVSDGGAGADPAVAR